MHTDDDLGTYRAVQALGGGALRLTRLKVQVPPPGHVRLSVEACGVCHTDALTVAGGPHGTAPRVPGHEIIGRIDARGTGVSQWGLGDRVGVGFLGGPCGQCHECRRGQPVRCSDQPRVGIDIDGGYAELVTVRASALVPVPDVLDGAQAAPLLCAGVTTFSALRGCSARAGDLVAVLGVGGLGHLAVQYARRMGFEVVAIARGHEKSHLALELGAHRVIDSQSRDSAAELSRLGGAAAIIATASNSRAISDVLGGLAPGGQLIVLGADPQTPLQISAGELILRELSVVGRLTGSPSDCEDTLAFSARQEITTRVELAELDDAPTAYARMAAGDARLRMVLKPAARATTASANHPHPFDPRGPS